MKMENMLWIEDIVKNTPTPPFLTNFRIDMIDYVDPHKAVLEGVHFRLSKCMRWS